MSTIKSLLSNVKGLLKVLFSGKVIYWQAISSSSRKCVFDKNANIHPLHNMLEVTVGRGTYISANSSISYTTIGKFCSIGPNLICGWGIHPLSGISTSPSFYSSKGQAGFTFSKEDKIQERKPISIGNDVFIGANVTVLDGVSIGDGAVIGAGAVVSKDIPAYAIAIGVPIKIVRYRFDAYTIEKLLEMQWWNGDDDLLKRVEEFFFDPKRFIEISGNDGL